MTAIEVLEELKSKGVKLETRDGTLWFHPAEAVSSSLLEKIRENKAPLIQLISKTASLRCVVCKGTSFWRGAPTRYKDGSTGPSQWVCRICHPPPKEDMVKEVLP